VTRSSFVRIAWFSPVLLSCQLLLDMEGSEHPLQEPAPVAGSGGAPSTSGGESSTAAGEGGYPAVDCEEAPTCLPEAAGAGDAGAGGARQLGDSMQDGVGAGGDFDHSSTGAAGEAGQRAWGEAGHGQGGTAGEAGAGSVTSVWEPAPLDDGFVAAAALHDEVYALSAVPIAGGQRLKRLTSEGWVNAGDRAGTSLTVSEDSRLWLVGAESSVSWRGVLEDWSELPPAACEASEPIRIRQAPGDNTIAAGETLTEVYVISDGAVRRHTGSCWLLMAALPAGEPRDLAMLDDGTASPARVWVRNELGTIFRSNGLEWVVVNGTGGPAGTAASKGLAESYSIGNDTFTLWRYSPTSDEFELQAQWSFGKLEQIGATAGNTIVQVAVTTAGMVYQLRR
jgi:hypothetical protein